jgi:hypothetical protein
VVRFGVVWCVVVWCGVVRCVVLFGVVCDVVCVVVWCGAVHCMRGLQVTCLKTAWQLRCSDSDERNAVQNAI